MKPTCINCKYYKIQDEAAGYCRKGGAQKNDSKTGGRPLVLQDHTCGAWEDCGQQYYIRLGWLKARQQKSDGPN